MSETSNLIELSKEQHLQAHAYAVACVEKGQGTAAQDYVMGKDMSSDKDPTARWYRGGLAELAMHSLLGTEPDWKPGRLDPGYDGSLSIGYTWDAKCVKGAPKFLPVIPEKSEEEPDGSKNHAVLYVLFKYHGKHDACEFIGWDYWTRVQRYPVDTLTKRAGGRRSHLVPRGDLRPWEDLERMHFKGIERFEMRHDGRTYPVSINHKRKAVKIEDVIYDKDQFARLTRMGPAAALKAHLVCQAMDGELLNVGQTLDNFEASLEGPTE